MINSETRRMHPWAHEGFGSFGEALGWTREICHTERAMCWSFSLEKKK